MTIPLRVLLVVSFLALVVSPALIASEIDRKTFVTFHEPMEIPGMVLPAGDYVMKQADRSLPDVIQFTNRQEDHVYATVFALPTYRAEPTDQVVILTEERRAQLPEAIKMWFYPGDTIGAEFIYPQSSERLLAEAIPPDGAATEQSAPAQAAEQSSAPAQYPSEQPQEAGSSNSEQGLISPSSPPQSSGSSTPSSGSQSSATPAQQPAPRAQNALPQTASILPLLGLMGVLLIMGGWSLRKWARNSS